MAIIGIPTEPSPILVPDNPDDILPPGYVPDGILPGVTNPDGSIITDENDLSVTGECVDHTDPCSEYWCLDDGCPPGCVPYVPPPEFPETPPKITQCLAVDTGFSAYYNFTDMYSMNNGQNVVLMNRDYADGMLGYRYADANLNPVYDRTAQSLPSCGSGAYVHSCLKLDEERLVMLVCIRSSATASSYFRIQIVNVITNVVTNNWYVPTASEWLYFGEPKITQYIENEHTILLSFTGRREAIDNAYFAIKVNLVNGEKLVEYLWRSSGVLYSSQVGALQVGDFVYLGYSSFRNPSLVDNGQVTKHNKIDGSYAGVFAYGEIVAGTSGRFNFGSKMLETAEHIVIFSGWYEHTAGRPLFGNAYKSYYTHLYIYDKQMNFIKRLSDESNTGGDLSHTGFGYGFSEYGNFFLIGTPGLNKVGLYDKNFNFLYIVNQSSPIMAANSSGAPVLMTQDKMYFGQSNNGIYASWDFKICDYTT